MAEQIFKEIKAIIGLGNPGPKYAFTRHNIGFMVADELATLHGGSWREEDLLAHGTVRINDRVIYLVKPLTCMNDSGKIAPWLKKYGLHVDELLVVHDELELPFGTIAYKEGGGAKGHNGLRSLIALVGEPFRRIRCGIGRPESRDQVANYVLGNFTEGDAQVDAMVKAAANEVAKRLG